MIGGRWWCFSRRIISKRGLGGNGRSSGIWKRFPDWHASMSGMKFVI